VSKRTFIVVKRITTSWGQLCTFTSRSGNIGPNWQPSISLLNRYHRIEVWSESTEACYFKRAFERSSQERKILA